MTKRPKAIYLIPVSGWEDDEQLENLLISGFDPPPRPGAVCLLVPIRDGDTRRTVRALYKVLETAESDDPEWEWDLVVESLPAPTPQYWFTISEQSVLQGLLPLLGTYEEGTLVGHEPTVEMVLDLLGF